MASASSRRPRLDRWSGLVVQRHGEVGQEGVGAGFGQGAVDLDGFFDCGECLFPPPQAWTGGWTGCSTTWRGRAGRRRGGLRPGCGRGRWLLRSRRVPLPAAPDPIGGRTGCSMTRRGWVGRRRGGLRPGRGGCWTASSIAASASSRRPNPPSGWTGCSMRRRGRAGRSRGGLRPGCGGSGRLLRSRRVPLPAAPTPDRRPDRLFNDMARSGRKASGRASARARKRLVGFFDRGQCLFPPPQSAIGGWTGCSTPWRGWTGRSRGGLRPGRGGSGRLLQSRPAPLPAAPIRQAVGLVVQ